MKFSTTLAFKGVGLLALAAWFTLSAQAQTDDRAGMFTAVRGTVTVSGKGGERPARMMGLFRTGETIVVQPQAQAILIYFHSGRREQLASGCTAVIQEDGARVDAGPAVQELAALDPALLEDLQRSEAVGSADRSGGVVGRDTNQTSDSTAQDKAVPPQSIQPVAPAPDNEPKGSAIALPHAEDKEQHSLLPGKKVTMQRETDAVSLEKTREKLEALGEQTPQDPSPRIALAALYSSRQMHSEAAKVLEALLTKYPDEPALLRMLAAEATALGDTARAARLESQAAAHEAAPR